MSGKAIRETLGFLAVVAGLVFVGLEIRQNTLVARAAAIQEIGIATAESWGSLAHDREFGAWFIAERSLERLASWDEADWAQAYSRTHATLRMSETLLSLVDLGLLEESTMEALGYGVLGGLLEDPVIACLWPQLQLGERFRGYVEQQCAPDQIDCSQLTIPALGLAQLR